MMSREQFLEALHQVGRGKYHHLHPFHQRMNAGELSPQAIRTWVANRFHYQESIPLKDAAIVSNCPLREVRRIWLHRIVDHDGQRGDEGGIGAWRWGSRSLTVNPRGRRSRENSNGSLSLATVARSGKSIVAVVDVRSPSLAETWMSRIPCVSFRHDVVWLMDGFERQSWRNPLLRRSRLSRSACCVGNCRLTTLPIAEEADKFC